MKAEIHTTQGWPVLLQSSKLEVQRSASVPMLTLVESYSVLHPI